MTDGSEWNMEIWRPEVVRHTRAQPECDMFNQGSSYFHVQRTTVCHMFCRMTNKICLQDSGVGDLSIRCGHESFAHKMAAWEICLQDGGNAAFLRVYPQDGGNKQNVNKNNVKYILRLHLVNVTWCHSGRHYDVYPGDREAVNIW